MEKLKEHNEIKYHVSTQKVLIKDFEELIKRYEKDLRYLAFKYVRNWTVVDDIIQEVFIKVFLNSYSFKNKTSIRSWLYTVTSNQCIDHLRSKPIKSTLLTDDLDEINISNTDSAEIVAIQQFETNLLYQMVNSLPNEYKEAIRLFYFNNFSYKEISELLNENIGTIKNRLFRGRRLLKEKYLEISKGLMDQ